MNATLLLVDDHPMMLDALRQAMEQQPHLSVLGEASTGESAVKLALELTPDLVVMDIHLVDMNGLEATRQILSALPATKILISSGDAGGEMVDEALRAGARGYVFKRGSVEELIRAIDEVIAGRLYLSPELSAAIVEDHQRKLIGESEQSKLVLSQREQQLLRLISKGLRNKEMATELNLSANTIETYRARLMKKVCCSSTAELVRYAIREGIAAL
jgi:DNA-binding NarL/FixJ family response regulator